MDKAFHDFLREHRDELLGTIRAGIQEINHRLDVMNAHLRELNGRVGKGELERAVLESRMKNVERGVFNRRHDDNSNENRTVIKKEHSQKIQERDVRIVLITIAGVVGVATFFWRILPAIIKIAQTTGP